MTDQKVAATILHQLGGGRFMAMTGAKALGYSAIGVVLSLPPSMTKGRANRLSITLSPCDLYTVETSKWSDRTLSRKVVDVTHAVDVASLHAVIETMTGLRTSL